MTFLPFASAFIAALAGAACLYAPAQAQSPAATAGTLKIGLIGPFTGGA